MRGSRKIYQRGFNSDGIFLVDKGTEDSSNTKSGPSSAHQRNVISMAFRWRAGNAFRWWADDGQSLNHGLLALRFFRGPGGVLL